MPSNKKISWGWKTLLAWTEISWGWKISSEQTNKMGLGNPACLNRNKLGMEHLQTETRRGCVQVKESLARLNHNKEGMERRLRTKK